MEKPQVIGFVSDGLLASVGGILHPAPEWREGALGLLHLAVHFRVIAVAGVGVCVCVCICVCVWVQKKCLKLLHTDSGGHMLKSS